MLIILLSKDSRSGKISIKRGVSMDKLFWDKIVSFHKDAHHLLDSQPDEEFLYWLKILCERDRRSLFLYLKENVSEFPEDKREIIHRIFPNIEL